MLCQFHIKNIGLMENVDLAFGGGLTVFTGETGAGKSMLIDALSVLLGGRATGDIIRHGQEQGLVEGVWDDLSLEILARLEREGFAPEDGQLFLSRELNQSGRNNCRIQGRIVPLSLYRTLCQGLADIHGQMEHQTLLHPETHRSLLDGLGGDEPAAVLTRVNRLVKEYKEITAEARELAASEAERVRREEFLRYQITEIGQIAPRPGEEEALEQEKKRLGNGERILNLANAGYDQLYAGGHRQTAAIDALGQVRKALGELVRLDPDCATLADQSETLYYGAEELAGQLRAYRDGLEFPPGRLDEIEERLIKLSRLRKYGSSAAEVLARRDEMESELERLTHSEAELAELQKAGEKAISLYRAEAAQLTALRRERGEWLEQELVRELGDLGMAHARVEVRFTPLGEPGYGGQEEIEFFFSANLGEPLKPLAKVASGGEMARLMLALKSILARVEPTGTFVFDEVDSGVGGVTIQKVGEKLTRIAETRQVFCITHSAQVAAYAHVHYRIYKEEKAGRTYTLVETLNEAERVSELARMLGGNSLTALRHAEEMRKNQIT